MKTLLEVHDSKKCIIITLNDESNEFIEDIIEEVALQLDRLNLIEDEFDDEDNDNIENENNEFN